MKPALALLLPPLALAWAAHAQPANPYDGAWSVDLACDDVKEKGALVKGYRFRFGAEVANGQLRGQYGSPGAPGSVTLAGTVAADGTLELQADGRSGNPDYTVDRIAQGTRYRYSMAGRLQGDSGSARRRELRPCTATFARQ